MRVPAAGLLAALLIGVPAAFAQEVTLSAEYEEYYFLVGQNVFFRVEVDNTYGVPISGTLISNIDHNDPGAGIQVNNTNSDQFNLGAGISYIDVALGVHNMPTTLGVDLLFSYIRDGAKLVDLDPITVHIVATPQEQQESEPISASSQEANLLPQQPQQNPLNNAQDRLQNNQLAQDSTALQQDIREQIAQNNESVQNLLDAARTSPEFAELNEELESQGYRMSSQAAAPDGDSSGTFDFEYVDDENRRASISGQITDNEVAQIRSQTQQELDAALDALEQAPEFQELAEQLSEAGYAQTDATITKLDDGSFEAAVSFADMADTPAEITAAIRNGTVTDIEISTEPEPYDYLPFIIAGLLAAGIASAVIYRWYKKKAKAATEQLLPSQPVVMRDFVAEYNKLLEGAAKSFDAGMQKLGYSMVSQALRLGLAHDAGVDTETSNGDLRQLLKDAGRYSDDVGDCLDTSSLVVFAGRMHDREDFEGVLHTARRLLDSRYAAGSERRIAATPAK